MRKLLGTFFGIGLIPGPAGTYASAVTAALAGLAFYLGAPRWSAAAATVAVTVLGILIGRNAERDFGGKDPRPFVLDEVAGMWIAGLAAWAPWTGLGWWATLAIAFVWFRVADVLKPPPARQLERLPHGWGIVLDDVAAGLMALGLTLASQAVFDAL